METDDASPEGFICRIAAPFRVAHDRDRLDIRRQLRFSDGTDSPSDEHELTACHADRKAVLGAFANESMIGGLVAEPDEAVPRLP